jgi:mRNA interferase YafQ
MYQIKPTKSFVKSYKKIKKSGIKTPILKELEEVVFVLAAGQKLPVSYRNHKLTGELSEYQECHIKGDLLLIYKIEKNNLILILADIGSHSELFK